MVKFYQPPPPPKKSGPSQKQNQRQGLFQAEHFRPKSCYWPFPWKEGNMWVFQ